MPDVSIVVVHDHIVPAMPRHLSLSIAQVRSRIDTCIVSIALRPVVHVCDNIRTVCVTTRVDAALIWYCSISIAMELHQRYGLTTRVARRRLLICIEVKGTGYRSKSCDTLGCLSVTCENASKVSIQYVVSRWSSSSKVNATSSMDLGASGSPWNCWVPFLFYGVLAIFHSVISCRRVPALPQDIPQCPQIHSLCWRIDSKLPDIRQFCLGHGMIISVGKECSSHTMWEYAGGIHEV